MIRCKKPSCLTNSSTFRRMIQSAVVGACWILDTAFWVDTCSWDDTDTWID